MGGGMGGGAAGGGMGDVSGGEACLKSYCLNFSLPLSSPSLPSETGLALLCFSLPFILQYRIVPH